MKYAKYLCVVLFGLSILSCPEGGEKITCFDAIYAVDYRVEYINNTSNNVTIYDVNVFDENTDILTNKALVETVLDPNSKGEFFYTWPSYSHYTELRSFFLQLEFNNSEYLLAGWPDWAYQQDNIVQYGIGYGTKMFNINFIRDGEIHSYDFGDVGNVYGKARLTINSEDDIQFEIIGDLSTDQSIWDE